VRHALFVAFHYPPEASSSGVLRTLKYTRYLGAHGWRVTVLTLQRDAYDVQDPALEAQIPATVRVIRTRYVNTKRHLSVRGVHLAATSIPDRWVGWWPWAVAAGRRVIQQDRVDLVYSTSPHATAHLVAGTLARHAAVPWVTDFRDPWYEDPPEPGTTRMAQWAARRLERSVVRRSARVVASTARLREALAARYPGERRDKFVSIPNGFDEADFAALGPVERAGGAELLIVHAGSINSDFRDPRPVFAAIEEAARAGTVDRSRLRFRFLGGGSFGDSPEMARAVAAAGLAGHVEFVARVPYEQALRAVAAADMVLLLQASADTIDLVPAKLFEYLRAGRPVLAVVRPGASAEALEQVGGGWAVDPRDTGGLRDALATAYAAWQAGRLSELSARPAELKSFSREHLTAELARQFDQLV
jgi:glycosyltransferase involved in cell wall biosynthesis